MVSFPPYIHLIFFFSCHLLPSLTQPPSFTLHPTPTLHTPHPPLTHPHTPPSPFTPAPISTLHPSCNPLHSSFTPPPPFTPLTPPSPPSFTLHPSPYFHPPIPHATPHPTRPSPPGPTPHLILQIPHPISVGELLKLHAALWLNAAVKATHVEEKVWIVLAVHRDEAHLPRNSCDGAGEAVLDVPEDSSTAGGEVREEGRGRVRIR